MSTPQASRGAWLGKPLPIKYRFRTTLTNKVKCKRAQQLSAASMYTLSDQVSPSSGCILMKRLVARLATSMRLRVVEHRG
jgi:hypothetical protein